MRFLLGLLPLHLLVYLGLYHREHGQGVVGLGELVRGLASYPAQLGQILFGGALEPFWGGLLSTGLYFGMAALLLWPGFYLLRRLPAGILWAMGGLPAFLTLVLLVMLVFGLSNLFLFWTPVEPGQPWMVGVMTLALMLPSAARVAYYLRLRQEELIRSDFARTHRSIGLSERRVRAKVNRVALPEAVSLMAGEAFGLAVAVMLLEGLMQFPGVGLAVYNALSSALGSNEGLNLGVAEGGAVSASPGLFLLLLLAGVYALLLEALTRRLDPRRQA
jgi:oligopeptide transport system permease protein